MWYPIDDEARLHDQDSQVGQVPNWIQSRDGIVEFQACQIDETTCGSVQETASVDQHQPIEFDEDLGGAQISGGSGEGNCLIEDEFLEAWKTREVQVGEDGTTIVVIVVLLTSSDDDNRLRRHLVPGDSDQSSME